MFEKSKLKKAIESGDVSRVNEILTRHPQLANQRLKGTAPTLALALEKASDEMVDTIISCCPDIDTHMDWIGPHIICDAVARGRLNYAKAWLAERPDLRQSLRYRSGQHHETLMHTAARHGRIDALEWLLQEGFDPLVLNSQGRTAMAEAVKYEQQSAVEFLRPYEVAAAKRRVAILQKPLDTVLTPDPANWSLIDSHTIAYAREDQTSGYRLTDIFNFGLGTCVTLHRNTETGVETPVRYSLSELAGAATLATAEAELQRQGGQLPASYHRRIVKG